MVPSFLESWLGAKAGRLLTELSGHRCFALTQLPLRGG
jgi:hypothetical protein